MSPVSKRLQNALRKSREAVEEKKRIAALEAENARLREALELFRQEFRSATEDGGKQPWRGLAVADAALGRAPETKGET